MACKDGVCQAGDADSDATHLYSDPFLLFVFDDLVSVSVLWGAESTLPLLGGVLILVLKLLHVFPSIIV